MARCSERYILIRYTEIRVRGDKIDYLPPYFPLPFREIVRYPGRHVLNDQVYSIPRAGGLSAAHILCV